MTTQTPNADRLDALLRDASASTRLQAALTAGSLPDPSFIEVLIARCGVEPDFAVRDTLTWAITRHDSDQTVPLLVTEARSLNPQARSQALHTLSKVGAADGWKAITPQALADPDDEVARSAWRAAVVLVPPGLESELADALTGQLGRGNAEMQRSLSRAFVRLGEAGSRALERILTHELGDDALTHALATQRLFDDPDEGFGAAVFEAKRILALRNAPAVPDDAEEEGSPG
ncbi:HEAT repeat domain-containing protein [Microbacterium schleiferi]|uniref:HEAT repeat domain-containing protein n=1 Tax=Microbacterium schleiferi TaxID=69362 RepID=UPI00311EFBF3